MAPIAISQSEAPVAIEVESRDLPKAVVEPSSKVDWTRMNFTYDHSNGHISSTFIASLGTWSEPIRVADPYLRVHGLAPGLNYGQQIYEGIKAFRKPDGSIHIFRPSHHAKRMQHSAACVSMPPIPEEHFIRCVHDAVAQNAEFVPPHGSGAALYIRPLCFGSAAQLQLAPPEEFTFVVFCQPSPPYHGMKPLPCIIMEEFDRAAPMGCGGAKVGGNYAPVIRWAGKALKQGYPMTLHLDSKTRTHVEEFSTSGFIGIKVNERDEVTLCVPDTQNAIESVTSRSCVDLAKLWGWTVGHRAIKSSELVDFNEVLAAGTAATLVSVSSITHASEGQTYIYLKTAEHGPIRNKLLEALTQIQQGKRADELKWMLPVNII